MRSNSIAEWFKQKDETKKNIFDQTSLKVGLPPVAVEKDWWVVNTLKLVFSLSCAEHLVFKGGTSLSKAWNIIERFSEDIDLALSKEHLGFTGVLSKSKVKRLREASCKFIAEDFFRELKQAFEQSGFQGANLKVIDRNTDDTDPIKIEVAYTSLLDTNPYLQSRVLIEVGSRSLMDPHTARSFNSFVSEQFKDKPFATADITIPVVNPERTLLEKIFLLHEEFQNATDKIKIERMSRHHYDIAKLMKTEFAKIALTDSGLYNTIVEHRKQINFLNYVDYTKHERGKLNIVPPDDIVAAWEKDYNQMKENMIYGEAPSFKVLIEEISKINSTINETESE